jgi:hypothetical protein
LRKFNAVARRCRHRLDVEDEAVECFIGFADAIEYEQFSPSAGGFRAQVILVADKRQRREIHDFYSAGKCYRNTEQQEKLPFRIPLNLVVERSRIPQADFPHIKECLATSSRRKLSLK